MYSENSFFIYRIVCKYKGFIIISENKRKRFILITENSNVLAYLHETNANVKDALSFMTIFLMILIVNL